MSEKLELLERWHGGDAEALSDLVAHVLPQITRLVRSRMGQELRSVEETGDLVQESLVQVLRDGPRFRIADDQQFSHLLARIVENTIRMRLRHFRRERRDRNRQERLPTVLDLDASATRPSMAAEKAEEEAWLQLAVELLDPDYREIIVLRNWHELSFEQIGQRFGVTGEAARTRFQRALASLAGVVSRIRKGEIHSLLESL